MALFVCFLIVAAVAAPALGLSSGAPPSACVDMVPGHGPPPQIGHVPFTLTPGKTALRSGQEVLLTITGETAENKVRGFMIQARQEGDTTALGHFVVSPDDGFMQVMDCGNGTGNAVTHKKHDRKYDKTSFTVTWVAPQDLKNDIEFRATIVEDFGTYWTGITSEKVKIY